eukprot:TRINITY_DN1526_c1_g1_i6.p1 TRINITY_DN1526_c1_g1~~TRINITY_DN1526_c1_g1_i6.p1  ORF type:complete len:135 (+),score=30.83 TRINITY_DN1526_c1_g1_i6:109-513(+)
MSIRPSSGSDLQLLSKARSTTLSIISTSALQTILEERAVPCPNSIDDESTGGGKKQHQQQQQHKQQHQQLFHGLQQHGKAAVCWQLKWHADNNSNGGQQQFRPPSGSTPIDDSFNNFDFSAANNFGSGDGAVSQ